MENERIKNLILSIGKKLSDYDYINEVVNNEKNFINVEGMTINPFRELTLSHGIPALCVLYGELNEQYPDEGFDNIGHEYMIKMGRAIEEQGISSLAMFSGACGIGLSAVCLSHNRTRYTSFIENINSFIEDAVEKIVVELKSHKYVHMSEYDIIEGMCGVANYCMLFHNDEKMKETLIFILDYIMEICKDKSLHNLTIPGWYIPSENQFLKHDQELWPNGCFNMGLSHGIPGMLLVLCNSAKLNITLPNQLETITKISDFLMKFHIENEEKNYWGSHVSLEEYINNKVNETNSRDAWCYGTPGVSYSLLVAGKLLNKREYIDSAVDAMKKAVKRLNGIYSPTFCHGFSGVAYISKRFYEITKIEYFNESSINLKNKVLDFYDEKAAFGFYNIEKDNEKTEYYNYIGIIDGAAGILLTILAIENGRKTPWDYAFSLQSIE